MSLHCEQCFAAMTSADQFCPNCGAPVTLPATPANSTATPINRCRVCAAPLQTGDRFCPACGATQSHPSPSPHQTASPRRQPPRSSVNTCSRCGKSIPSGNRFCIGCGAPAGGAASAPQPPQPATATASAHPKPATAPQPGNATYQTPIQAGNIYHCPKCNAALTPGLKICQVCGVAFVDPVPHVRTPIAQPTAPRSNVSSRGNGFLGLGAILAVLVVIGWGVFSLAGGKGMTGTYTDGYGFSSINFQSNGQYAYRGPDNFSGVYDLQGNTLHLLPPQEQLNKMTPEQRNDPFTRAMLSSLSATVSNDRTSFDLAGVQYHRQ